MRAAVVHIYLLHVLHASFPTGCDWLYPRQIFRLKPLGQGKATQLEYDEIQQCVPTPSIFSKLETRPWPQQYLTLINNPDGTHLQEPVKAF